MTDFTTNYGQLIRIILSRIVRSNRARSQFEQSILLHLKQLTQNNPQLTVVNSTLVDRICEAMLSGPAQAPAGH